MKGLSHVIRGSPRGFLLLITTGRVNKSTVSMERLVEILPAAYDNYQLLVLALEQMVHYRIETLSQLNRIADELDKRHRVGNIVKVAGTATGTAGSAVAATAVALAPFTGGSTLVFMVGGGLVAALGSLTAIGAQVTEKVYEKVDLEKVQQAVDRDKAQCERVLELWKEFESYCDDTINTIALADPSEGSHVEWIQTWIQVGMEVVKSPVVLVAEAFESLLSMSKKEADRDVEGEELCEVLVTVASKLAARQDVILRSVVSCMKRNVFKVAGVITFVVLSAVFVGNVFALIITLIDMHKGSPSKVAKELRQRSTELQKELDKWLDNHTTIDRQL